ncbi:MAG: 3-deoxy-D-manno-octulosonic acid transferase [Opitutaceae bacterium]|jgi:3-deoxy-D-manno-octulosonic-acid transferase|nr:3-deoxy-D-manno-octulosonic acid transferase [Opitutaceae bacterium]
MMLWIYRLLFLPVLCITAPYYLFRMRKRGGYRRDFQQRFGAVEKLPPGRAGVRRVWLQAVSVGEMLAIAPVLEALKRRGDVEVYLTTTTSTGRKIAEERYRGLVAGIGYFPTDWWLFSARAWRAVQPDLVMLTEGERWPEHIAQARKRGVPVLAVNARLSDRSFRRMRAWRGLMGPLMLRGISRVLACSKEDASRFRALGVDAGKITVTGNIKWDVTIPLMDAAESARLRKEIGLGECGVTNAECGETEAECGVRNAECGMTEAEGGPREAGQKPDGQPPPQQNRETVAALRPDGAGAPHSAFRIPHSAFTQRPLVLLGSSTWPGEETALVDALAALRAAGVAARLLLVPRHMERRAEVGEVLRGRGFSWHLRSRGAAPGAVDIAVGDTTGELRKFTQLADLVFVGKSLPPHTGGQTPVEAAALGKPILMGPGMSNFREITRYLTESGAARVVGDADELRAMVLRLLATAPEERAAMAGAARACHKANQGAVARTVEIMAEELARR